MRKSTDKSSECQPAPEPDPTTRPGNTAPKNNQPAANTPESSSSTDSAAHSSRNDFLFGANEPDSPDQRPLIPGIDLDSLALEEGYADDAATEEVPTTIVVRKPSGQGYFRTHPELHRNVRILEIKNGADRGFYLVGGGARALLLSEECEDISLFPARLTLCYSRDSGLFLWPLRLPEQRKNNQLDEWALAALKIVMIAEAQWTKMYTVKGGNCYSHKVAEGIKMSPPWPDLSMNEIASLAFENKYITDPEDPLIRRLLGKE
jgi:hypothetical protein